MKESERSSCPAKDLFVRAFLDELPRKEKIRLLDHALICPRCRLRFRALAGINRQAGPLLGLEATDGERPRRSRVFSGPGRIAAALLVVIGIGAATVALLSRRPASPLLRGRAESLLRLLEPGESLPAAPSSFRWMPFRDAEAYEFEIVAEDLTTILKTGVKTASIKIPESVRRLLVRGKTYIWTVTAYDDRNQRLSTASGVLRVE